MLINRRKDASQAGAADAELTPRIALAERDGVHQAVLTGNWTTRRVAAIDAAIRQIEKDNAIKSLQVDLSGVGRIDTAGAWLIERLLAAMRSRGVEPAVSGASEAARILLEAVEERRGAMAIRRPSRAPGFVLRCLEALGRHMYAIAGRCRGGDLHPRRDDPRRADEDSAAAMRSTSRRSSPRSTGWASARCP